MKTKLYVLGAVLGAAPGLLPLVSSLPVAATQETRQEARSGARKGRGARAGSLPPAGNHAVVAPPPELPGTEELPDAGGDGHTRSTGEADVPRHPCELITIMQVPCDASREVCEYTYWECPEAVDPLRA